MSTRACWYRAILRHDLGRPIYSEWISGKFHSWTLYHDEYEAGPGHFPAAIVEDGKTGAVIVTRAFLVHFGSNPHARPDID